VYVDDGVSGAEFAAGPGLVRLLNAFGTRGKRLEARRAGLWKRLIARVEAIDRSAILVQEIEDGHAHARPRCERAERGHVDCKGQ
jgi:hypothetical protein